MSERHREHDTVDAIRQLQDKYPFATGLLIYCLIERMLKYFIVDERNKPHSKLHAGFLQLFRGKNGNDLLQALTDITLGGISNEFNSAVEKDQMLEISRRRNGYMHSNFLYPPIPSHDREERHRDHQERLRQAVKDLKDVFDIIGDNYEVVRDNNGNICDFRTK